MKVLMLNDYKQGDKEASGAERFITLLKIGLEKEGLQVELRTFFPRNPNLKDVFSFDVVHVNNYRAATLETQELLRDILVPVFFTIHDYMYICTRRNMLTEEGYPCSFVGVKSVCKKCVMNGNPILPFFLCGFPLVFPSANMMGIYEKHSEYNGEMSVIPHGVDVYTGASCEKDSVDPLFLFTGRLSYEKGLFEMLAAFRSVHSVFPEAKLIMSNSGDSYLKICALIERMELYDSVKLLNRVSRQRLEELYSEALCILAPSIWEEPFNFTITEAYAHGKPVLASRIGAHPELVEDRVTGLLHDPFDTKAFEDNMLALLANEGYAKTMGNNGLKRLETCFNTKKMVRGYLSLIEKLSG